VKECGGPNKLLIARTAGDIKWGALDSGIDWSATTSLPSRLQAVVSKNPIVIDLS
jgi:hypothetical protein